MKDDQIKDAFQKVKRDIFLLTSQVNSLKLGIEEMRKEMLEICQIMEKLSGKIKEESEKIKEKDSTQKPETPTFSTYIPTHYLPSEALKPLILPISIGNQGVPTNRQTDKQTNRQMDLKPKIEEIEEEKEEAEEFKRGIKEEKKEIEEPKEIKEDAIKNASEILDSLDSLKKEIRLKFKRLTNQETLVFSTIYQLEEEKKEVDYKAVAKKLNLTESSIRDYVGRLIKKGIPVEKKRINNKMISLSISNHLKKIASLNTILKLKDI